MTSETAALDPVPFPRVPTVIFAHWREALNKLPLSGPVRSGYGVAIAGYLDYCLRNNISVTRESARAYMSEAERRQLTRNPQLWKDSLNWFFHEGRRSSGLGLPGTPSTGAADTGRTDWERRMVERLRLARGRTYEPRTRIERSNWSGKPPVER